LAIDTSDIQMSSFFERVKSAIKRVLPTTIVFDDGSQMSYENREALRYTEKALTIEIIWFFDASGSRGRVINFSHIDRWDGSKEDELLGIEKRREILAKVVEYCRIRKIHLKIAGGEADGDFDKLA